MNNFRNPPGVHAPVAAYSHQVEVHEPARWLMLSGQIGMRADGSVPDDPIEQLDVAFDNVWRNLEAAEMGLHDVVKLVIYLVGEFDLSQRRAVIARHLAEHRPCVTLLFIAGLAQAQYKVEIEAWACQPLPSAAGSAQ